MFAAMLREGSWVDARVDTAIPDRKPFPKSDLRSMHRPLGPVVVFGASNFPFAISVMGSDTVAALAVGCPVVAKRTRGIPTLVTVSPPSSGPRRGRVVCRRTSSGWSTAGATKWAPPW